MRPVPGFDHHLELHRLGRQVGEDALMRHLDDVGAGLAQDRDDGRELAGPVDNIEPQLRQPAFAGEKVESASSRIASMGRRP